MLAAGWPPEGSWGVQWGRGVFVGQAKGSWSGGFVGEVKGCGGLVSTLGPAVRALQQRRF